MSLFNKKESTDKETTVMATTPVKAAKSSSDVISSVISTDMKITGEVSFKGKARIDGYVEGNINGDNLILSESGKVKGDVHLTTLICHGSVEGNVKAQQVTAHSSSSIKGNLVATSLTVESGATLQGEVSSSQPQSQPKASPIASTASPTQKAEAAKKEETKS